MAKNKTNNHGDYFDDCPLCQAMKIAEEKGEFPSPMELREAMKKARKQGAIVGGTIWDEGDKPEA